MAMEYPWYGIVEGENLRQGDFLDRCPVLVPKGPIVIESNQTTELQLDGYIEEYDVVIMSQSCDLEQDKLDFVLVCPHWSLEELGQKNEYLKSSKGKEDLRRGHIPGYHLLAACELEGMARPLRVVDFRTASSLPLEFLKQFASSSGRRLQLLPPYREHLAQAFARFFMRVGLPADIPPFRK
jgi:hypothetical protein